MAAALTKEEFASETGVSRETLGRLERHLALLVLWQARINLVGRATLADPWRRHFLDSAQLVPLIPAGARTLVDLGSGAGFPGLVLAALRPDLETHLVEADSRKCAFLRAAAAALGVGIALHEGRIEAIPPIPADVVTARALAPLPRLLALAEPFTQSTGCALFPKGARAEAELTESRKRWKLRVERFPSRSDPAATVLRLWDIARERPG